MERIGLLDSDIVAYQITASGETKVDWDGDGNVDRIPEDIETMQSRCDQEVESLIERLALDDMIVCLSCETPDNFRLQVDPTYKGNRDPNARPLQLLVAKQYLADTYRSYRKPNLEADDVMGILSTHPKLVKGRKVIISEDKDMKTIPGWLFNPRKDRKPRQVSLEEADRFHLYQTLTGDTVDFYPGCPGIGPKKAETALEEMGPTWSTVVAVYAKRLKLTEEEAHARALVQARLARILRASDYDFKAGRPVLWQPN